MVEMMVKNKNIDLNMRDKYGINAFWIAAFYGYVEIVKLLMSIP